MIIQIDGTGTVNKGAELMLYAITEQIEHQYPNAKVVINTSGSIKGIRTKLNIMQPKRLQYRFNRYIRAVLNRLNILYFSSYYPKKNINILLDGSGFRFGDQWNRTNKELKNLDFYYKKLKQNGTKIILLSQALGPFETESGKRCVSILNKYTDVVIVRDPASLKYFLDAGGDKQKTYLFPDFTARVNGQLPEKLSSLRGAVCIIPNSKMIQHTGLGKEQYLVNLGKIVTRIIQSGCKVFILNHEGKTDLEICDNLNRRFKNELKLVAGLNAKEIKGVIGNALFVISGRYHGVASALNQGVPCLATSWSHKYEFLFQDFGLTDCIIDLENNIDVILAKTDDFLTPSNLVNTRSLLATSKGDVSKKNDLMWKRIWESVNSN